MRFRLVSILSVSAALLMGIFLMYHGSLDNADGWDTGKPEYASMDADILDKLAEKLHAGELGKRDSLIIVRDGRIIFEEYSGQYKSNMLHTVQSQTKSILSLLIGIAIDQGKIRDIDENVLNFYQGDHIQNVDKRKQSITIRDLLTMRGGFDWDEWIMPVTRENPVVKMNSSFNWLKVALDTPMAYSPGLRFQYNGGGAIILADILKKSTGMDADHYAQKYLFDSLGIKNHFWIKQFIMFGMPHSAGGLFLAPRDMAKIGQLILNRGNWNEKRIISEKWIDACMKPHVDTINMFNTKLGYGYLWWLYPNDATNAEEYGIYACSGHGGQLMFVIPRYDMVVVTNASEYEDSYKAQTGAMDILYNYVLKAVKPIEN